MAYVALSYWTLMYPGVTSYDNDVTDQCKLVTIMMSVFYDKQADIIDAFNTTSKYLDDILNINNAYFDTMVSQIYPPT